MDSKLAKEICPQPEGWTRTHVYFGIDKFEIVQRQN
jgi:hypothetical protein